MTTYVDAKRHVHTERTDVDNGRADRVARPWRVLVAGEPLRDRQGRVRRFKTEALARNAAGVA